MQPQWLKVWFAYRRQNYDETKKKTKKMEREREREREREWGREEFVELTRTRGRLCNYMTVRDDFSFCFVLVT